MATSLGPGRGGIGSTSLRNWNKIGAIAAIAGALLTGVGVVVAISLDENDGGNEPPSAEGRSGQKPPHPLPQCSDGHDNDGDTKDDANDSGCKNQEDDSESPDPGRGLLTLAALEAAGQIHPGLSSDEGEYGTKRMKGSLESYPNGVSVAVYPDDPPDSGARMLEISFAEPLVRLRGVVGIRAEAPCPQNKAQVSIEDGEGRRLFSAKVSRSGPKAFSVPVRGLAEVRLVQTSLASDKGCAQANPAWGAVEFLKG